MAPANQTQQHTPDSIIPAHKQKFKFVFKDTEYDCTDYAKKHPGGSEFFEKYSHIKSDITEYFSTLHSKQAEKVLKSLPETGKVKKSKDSELFDEMEAKVKHLYKNNYFIDFAVAMFVVVCFIVGHFTSNPFLAIFCIASAQIVCGWLCHSWCHGRDKYLYKFSRYFSGIFQGLSANWWNRKHNLHHMFTNVHGKDDDILHNYNKAIFGFLYLKWKYDSILTDYNCKWILVLIIHHIVCFQQNIIVYLVAQYIAGYYSGNVLVGNHEHEQMFENGKHELGFFEHQLSTSLDYDYTGYFWMLYMGGMQYQAEHHLFPQIPFYNTPQLSKIMRKELAKHNLKVKVGDFKFF